MNAKLAFAISIALVTTVTTAGCSSMGRMFSGGSTGDSRSMDSSMSSSMQTPAPVPVDPAGTATSGTGSVSRTGVDERMNTAAGLGMDSD